MHVTRSTSCASSLPDHDRGPGMVSSGAQGWWWRFDQSVGYWLDEPCSVSTGIVRPRASSSAAWMAAPTWSSSVLGGGSGMSYSHGIVIGTAIAVVNVSKSSVHSSDGVQIEKVRPPVAVASS